MKSRFSRALIVCAALAAVLVQGDTARAVSSTVVISEFRVRGSAGGNDEFVELYNASTSPVPIGGWTMRGSNAGGTTGIRATVPVGTTLGAGCFYLFTNSGAAGYSLGVPGNLTYGTGITDDGGVAVFDSLGTVVDQAGMSAGSAYKEGAILTNLGSSNQNRSYERKPGGAAGNATDTDNNATDFALITPSNPQNLGSACITSTPPTTTSPAGSGSATPSSVAAGGTTQLTVNVTLGTNPSSTGITVTGDLSAIGGSSSQAFQPGAGNSFTYSATVAPSTTPGIKTLPISVADAQGRSSGFSLLLTVSAPLANSTIVISQVYGGGGNGGATYQNDYVQLYNRGTTTVDTTGWSLQYASATGTNWDNRLPLGGPIGPGEYYLIALGSTDPIGAVLPPANVSFDTNISASAGKIALVDNYDILSGGCPVADPHVKDFVGYGPNATCREGAANAPAASNTLALFRQSGGFIDTNENGSDFATGPPAPIQTAPIVELGPQVLSTDPRWNSTTVPRDATIQIDFTEPVDVSGAWFDITCPTSGSHNDATFAGGGRTRYITPNVNFVAGETCTVTVYKDQVTDQDLADSAPNTSTLPANYVWSFAIATGTAPPFPSSVHLAMGNPTSAVADINQPTNYLMEKPEFTLSYNRDLGRPNWVSWHLSQEWVGSLTRFDTFRPDPAVPADWYRVQSFDFQNSGFDRGHLVPNADRDKETSIPINQATFLMSNMLAQAPNNNQGPWADFENYLRGLLPQNPTQPAGEIYIVSGGWGAGGTGSNGGVTTTLAGGRVTVPHDTWKVALVLPAAGGDDASRVSCTTRTIAVIMPNTQTLDGNWQTHLTTVDAVETLTGYNFFSVLPEPIQRCVEAGVNGDNPDLVKGDQAIIFAAPADRTYGDAPFTVSATGGPSGNPVTFAATGACTVSGATITIASAGPCSITASQAGSDIYNAAPDVVRTLTVNKAAASLSSLTVVTIEAGTATTALGGSVTFGALVPTGNVTITLNGVSQTVAVGPGGAFSASFATASLAPSTTPYPVAYVYSGDTNFTSTAGTGSVTVTDTTAPSIGSVSVSHPVLSPPNHNMIDITIGYQVADVTAAPVCSLSVSSNETINGSGDGNTSIDWQVLDQNRVQLRSERAGGGSGRIYTITITCTDTSGNIGSATTTVSVPK